MDGVADVPRQRRPAVVIAGSRSPERDTPRFQNLVVHAFAEWTEEPDHPPVWYHRAA